MKNKKKLLVLLLLLLLASATVVTTAFAKYTDSKDGGGTAGKVATWGVTINAGTGDLFKETYTDSNSKKVIASASTGTNVMAPGATGKVESIGITGTPEVAVTIKMTPTVTLTGWSIPTGVESNTEIYFPLEVKVGGTKITWTDATDLAKIKADIEAKLTKEVSYEAGSDLSSSEIPTSIEWKWEFTSDGADVKDTKLAATSSTFGISYTISVEQILALPAAAE